MHYRFSACGPDPSFLPPPTRGTALDVRQKPSIRFRHSLSRTLRPASSLSRNQIFLAEAAEPAYLSHGGGEDKMPKTREDALSLNNIDAT